MLRVKVIKLDERYAETRTKQEEQYLGEIYEAFELYLDYEEEGYKKQYGLNMGKGVWFLPVDCCEVVEDISNEVVLQKNFNGSINKENNMKQVLTISDLATINYLVNREVQSRERMAREEYIDENIFEKIILPLNNKKVKDTLKSDLFYQDLLHLKNALNNINVEVETADIKVK